MTNEELDNAREIEAIRIYDLEQDDPKAHGLARIAARLAREGWTPPATVDPEVGSIWKHYNGGVYEVIAIANTLDTEKYPKAVIHKNTANGTVWTRRADDWHRSYTKQTKTSEPLVDPDLLELETLWLKYTDGKINSLSDTVLAGIKRGRELERAEAKPGMVWLKHDGASESPVAGHRLVMARFKSDPDYIGVYNAIIAKWSNITHYAVITQPGGVA